MAAITSIGTGTTITFDSTFFAEVTSATWSGMSRGVVDSSHMGTTGGRTFLAGKLYDPGSMEVEFHFLTDKEPLVIDTTNGATFATCTITVPSGDATTDAWSASAIMTDFEFTTPLEDKMNARCTLKFSGNITRA